MQFVAPGHSRKSLLCLGIHQIPSSAMCPILTMLLGKMVEVCSQFPVNGKWHEKVLICHSFRAEAI